MAGSAHKDLALGDSVKVTTPIEELVATFGNGQPMVFQVKLTISMFPSILAQPLKPVAIQGTCNSSRASSCRP